MAKKKPIISPLGQWAYPGEVTVIPSSNITMKGVNYPVLGIDDLGNQQMMMPGGEYTFPGNYVTEIPQMGKGGLSQWFDEKWVDVKTGKTCGRSGKDKDGRPYPACRPSKRVNETTPKTTSEMSSAEKARFKREKTSGKRIDYNHKRREDGGETWLDQYQVGGIRRPIYTSNPRDPRIGRYTDSLNLYNKNTLAAYNLLKKYPDLRLPKVKNTLSADAEFASAAPYGIDGAMGNRHDFYGKTIMLPKIIGRSKIKPVGYQQVIEGQDHNNYFPVYKKPVQPIIYKKPTIPKPTIPKPVIPKVVVPLPIVPPPIAPIVEQPVKKIGYNKPVIQQFNYMSNENKAKALKKYGSVGDIPFQGVDINQLKDGGWLDQFQTGGPETSTEQNPDRMQGVDIRKKRSWSDKLRGFINQGEKAIGLDPYNERSDDFMEQWARRVNDATGGRDWYKQPNDASGPGGIGTAMMETVMAPFSAPQLASVYGATGKVQMPSEAMNIQNPVGSFLADAILDPTNLVGAGLTKTGQRIINYVPEQITKLAESQIKKSPKLAMSLQRGRPVSLDNVNTISGIRYGDIQPFPVSTNALSENAFFKQLEKGARSLDNSVSRRVADLESEEGFRRLVEQEKAYLFDNTDTDLSVIDRVAKLNAKARIEELKNIKNVNKEAAEYANTNFLGTGLTNPFVEDSYLYNNAYHRPASLYDQFVKSSGTLNLKKPIPNYSKSIPGEIGMGYNFVGDVPTEMHEIAHALQRGRKLSLDNGLTNIVPKKDLDPINQRQYKYFKKGSHGQEPTAFANELREAMFQKGFIPDYYTPINQQQVQDAYKYFKKNPMGIYDKNTGNFSSNTRIFDFMAPTKANSKLITDVLNRLPAVAPLAVGTAAASQLQEQRYGGWLDTYQDGGENLPELNSKIDIANFYKNPLSEKYGIYQDPEDNTYKYYLKSGEESQILEYGPDLSNLDKQKLKEINIKKGSLSEEQLSNIQPVSQVILPKNRDQILRDKLYYEQDDLMEQAISESPIPSVKTPTYSEMLDADPEFKKVMTEKPKLVAPIKPKPVATNTPLIPIANAPRAIVRPAVRKVVAKNDIVNLADLTITKADKAYLNKVDEYCPGGNCLETTRNAYDMLAGRIQGIPTSSDIWSKDLNVHSKKGTPTADDIKNYPYFAGDSGSGTLDSWDAHGRIVETGGKNFYNINTPTPINYKEIPVGALIGWGPKNRKDSKDKNRNQGYNIKFGMQPSHHSTMVVGYSEDGEPIVYDGFLEKYMTLTEAKANIGSRLDYELENISAPKSVLNNTQDNLKNQGILLNYIPPTNVNPNKILTAVNQPWAQIQDGSSKRAPRFNKEMMVEFNSALINNKGELMRNLNMSSEKYDELYKIALAISAQESEGGGALSLFDNDSVGMTQLITDNIFKDDKLKKAAAKPYMLNDGTNNILSSSLIQKSPSASAVATMIYLSQLEKSAQAKYAEGKIPKERSVTKINYFKDKLRSNTAKYNSDGFFVEEANKRIDLSPFEGGMFSDINPVGAAELLNKTADTTDKYKVEVKDGDLVIKYKTKGNADLSNAEIIAYGWNSLTTLKSGDAQGDSVYTRRIKNYYDLLNNTTPTYRKEGGETGWLNKYK
jgi:hypothetical protein